jgi:hypothetical protein
MVVTSCGSDNNLSISANKDNVCSQIADVACHNLYQCCSEGEIEKYLNVTDPESQGQCQDDLTKRCQRDLVKLTDSINNKRATFDSKTMNDCLESIVAPNGVCASVDTMLPWVDACMNSAWVGAVADGGMCYATYECASKDSFCAPNETCTALPGANQPCSPNGCATGLYCATGATCQPLVVQNGTCTSTSQCQKDLFCDFSLPTPVCSALHDGGQACTGNATCKSNQCLPGTCSNSAQTCYASNQCNSRCATGGNFCNIDSDCGEGRCSNSSTTFCTVDGQCNLGSASSGTCVFTNHCTPGTCQGEIVCASAQLVVDYCTDALGALPTPP